MPATIRPRTNADLPALAQVLVEVHALDGYPVEGVDDPLAWLDLPDAIGAWTAEFDGQIVGHVALTEPGTSDHAPRMFAAKVGSEPVAVLGRLFVSPRARSRGIAQLLAEEASRAAAAAGRRPVLDVMEKDRVAIRLYERLGWSALGRVRHRYGASLTESAIAMAGPPPGVGDGSNSTHPP